MPEQIEAPPKFVMWKSVPLVEDLGWQRQWFGNELDPTAVFNVRGVGIREPMFNENVHRPIGTGDWLIMYFHQAARLERNNSAGSSQPNSLVLWPPGAEQFYSWANAADVEPHSWMHVEGTCVAQQVEENRLPTAIPITVENESLMICPLQNMMDEMTRNETPDLIILQNLFQNWARSIARHLQTQETQRIPPSLLKVRLYLDEHFTETTPLDDLARIACMSRSHLCHRFREHFGTTISSYVIRRRMSIAQRMLFDINLRPGEIAKEIGYPDIYQFSKQFKKTFGVSPTQYRKQHT
ncbi:MAG: hypothetical protein COA78_19120 [Blastopirellula sp.]|nr:MAG: hypothetical protein COA78_19120 [Blastopirellula sp.]